jgi:hypothetical protein
MNGWEVAKEIPLVAICYHSQFIKDSKHTQELFNAYQSYLAKMPVHIRDRSIDFTTYLADEFAKQVHFTDPESNYMISALFTEQTISHGKAGIYYPSVKTNGLGFNVAIAPEVVD